MISLINSILLPIAFALPVAQSPIPIFLKEGFSSILEFEDSPTQVVLGDSSGFQIERLKNSIVIKPLVAYAVTNMFVYFKEKPVKLFLLSASEDSEPTYLRKIETFAPSPKQVVIPPPRRYTRGANLTRAFFDSKKDYLVVELTFSADSTGKVIPNWDLSRLKFKDQSLAASKLWSERHEVQKDSSVRARFVFTKPNVPRDLKDVSLVVPVVGERAFQVILAKGRQ
ncbi:MAG: hypothetical protein AB7F86_10035 [Bdellovibrionales bacterium]